MRLFPYDNGEYKSNFNTAYVKLHLITETVIYKNRRSLSDEELLSKQSCWIRKIIVILVLNAGVHEFNGINSTTNKQFTEKEIEIKESNSLKDPNEQNTEERVCCDPNDYSYRQFTVIFLKI